MRVFAVFVALLISAAFAFAQSFPGRQKSLPPINFNYLDGQGYTASIVSNFTITLQETEQRNGKILTTYSADYDIYNKTWAPNQYGIATGNVFDLNGDAILAGSIRVTLDRASCTYHGARHIHYSGTNYLPNFLDIISSIQISTDRVSGSQGLC